MKEYLNFDASKGYPTGRDLFYECTICGISIPSHPDVSMGCKCGNIFIDVDYGRVSIKREKEIKIFRENSQG